VRRGSQYNGTTRKTLTEEHEMLRLSQKQTQHPAFTPRRKNVALNDSDDDEGEKSDQNNEEDMNFDDLLERVHTMQK
jgi:hypothetical protein